MSNTIFICYSRKDSAVMQQVRDSLKASGFMVWTDEGIEPGTPSWKQAIEKAILSAGCVIAMMSPDANASEWVRKEMEFAEVQRKPVLLLLAGGDEATAIPFGYAGAQYVDLRDKQRFAAGMGSVVETLRKRLASAPAIQQSQLAASDQYAAALEIEDVFNIKGRGIVVTGKVAYGTFKVDDLVHVLRGDLPPIDTTAATLEQFRKVVQEVKAGEFVGILLRDVQRDDIQIGNTVVKR